METFVSSQQAIGGTQLVARTWWHALGSRHLVARTWWRALGGRRLVAGTCWRWGAFAPVVPDTFYYSGDCDRWLYVCAKYMRQSLRLECAGESVIILNLICLSRKRYICQFRNFLSFSSSWKIVFEYCNV